METPRLDGVPRRPQVIRGVVGLITWEYYEAARLEGFRAVRVAGTWSVVGRVIQCDPFKMRQQPLWFVVPLATGRRIRWAIETVTIADGRLEARLGAMEG
jgi:hypothetical protein